MDIRQDKNEGLVIQPHHYELSAQEMQMVIDSTILRISESYRQKHNPATTYERTLSQLFEENIMGCKGEIAWAGIRGVPWHNPVNEFHNIPDDGVNEIRTTRTKYLINRNNDAKDRRYVLATIDGHIVTFHGWAWGKDIQVDKYYGNPHGHRPCWMMPIKDLRQITFKKDLVK